MSVYSRAEVCGLLDADVYLGAREAELSRFSTLRVPSASWTIFHSMLPKALGRKFEPSFIEIAQTMVAMVANMKTTSISLRVTHFTMRNLHIPFKSGQPPSGEKDPSNPVIQWNCEEVNVASA